MTKRIYGYLIAFLISICLLVYRFFISVNPSDLLKELIVPIAIAGVTSPIVVLTEIYFSNSKYFLNTLKCKTLLRNKRVYVSLSYLIQIKLDGNEKYFLVRGKKVAYQFQPVGGVYKYANSINIPDKWSADFKSDKNNMNDLRFFVRAKYIPEIIKWFKSGLNREIGIWREFKEELLDTNILTHENFSNIDFEYLKTEEKIMNPENRFENEKYHTILYDVFRINLSEPQLNELRELLKKKSATNDYTFVTAKQIKQECFKKGKEKIGQHTKFLLNN